MVEIREELSIDKTVSFVHAAAASDKINGSLTTGESRGAGIQKTLMRMQTEPKNRELTEYTRAIMHKHIP